MTIWNAGSKRGTVAGALGAALLASSSIGLASPASAVGTLDQSTSTSNSFYDMPSSGQWLSQTFTAGLSGVLSQVDVGFAKTGNPAHKGIPAWQKYTAAGGATMFFDNQCVEKYNHDRDVLAISSQGPRLF